MSSEHIIKQTQCWLKTIIIGLNFCPFANREFQKNSIRYSVVDDNSNNLQSNLHTLASEFQYLDQYDNTQTTLLIFSQSLVEFDDFLELIDFANQILEDLGYLGIYQLAHFHPQYCFADADPDDTSNYTNRSPYPTLHIIREKSLQHAIESHPDITEIPNTNIKLANELGTDKMQFLLDTCKNQSHKK